MPKSDLPAAQLKSVLLSRINSQDDTFHITTRTNVDDLLVSIRRDGLLNPPLLIRKTSSFSVISGFRRIGACQKLGCNEIIARILKADHSSLACLRLAIADNALQRPLNLIETSRSLQKLSSYLNNSKRLAESALTLGLPTNPSIIHKIKDLCLLPWPIQSSILAGTISLSMAIELESLEQDNAIAFARMFDRLKISLNKQREIVTLVKEIARRDNIATQMVMEDKKLKEIINNEDLDRGQKGQKIRSILRQRRFPRLVKAQNNFEIQRKKLKLGNDIKLIPPKEFEGTTYALNLTFNSPGHLKTIQTRLNKIIRQRGFEKIFIIK